MTKEGFRNCLECGALFIPRMTYQKYCSAKCCRKHSNSETYKRKKGLSVVPAHTERECEVCGKKFVTAVAHQKYCSAECYRVASNARKKKAPVTKRECPICGEKFKTTDSRQKYCSAECYSEANRLFAKERYRTAAKADKTKILTEMSKLLQEYLAQKELAQELPMERRSLYDEYLRFLEAKIKTAAQSFVASYEEHDIRGDNCDG